MGVHRHNLLLSRALRSTNRVNGCTVELRAKPVVILPTHATVVITFLLPVRDICQVLCCLCRSEPSDQQNQLRLVSSLLRRSRCPNLLRTLHVSASLCSIDLAGQMDHAVLSSSQLALA